MGMSGDHPIRTRPCIDVAGVAEKGMEEGRVSNHWSYDRAHCYMTTVDDDCVALDSQRLTHAQCGGDCYSHLYPDLHLHGNAPRPRANLRWRGHAMGDELPGEESNGVGSVV